MWSCRLAVGVLLVTLGTGAALAADTPAEMPPASYDGREYVDSQGCVFVRAGLDGTVTWVPRVTRDKQQVCGLRPTFPPEPEVVVVDEAPEPAPVAAPPKRKPKVAAARHARKAKAPAVAVTRYKPAFEDGRLNPLRGPRTAVGDRLMALVLDTRTVPMRAATPESRAAVGIGGTEVFSTKSVQPVYVQAGSFASAANAQLSARRLQAAGLPVRIVASRGLQTVLAGPFSSSGQARHGLTLAREAGFADAFLRR